MNTGRRRKAAMKTVCSSVPFERIAVYVFGPLPKTARGNTKLLVIWVIWDYFTKWIVAYPIHNETEVVAEKNMSDFVYQGRNLESQLFQQVCSGHNAFLL